MLPLPIHHEEKKRRHRETEKERRHLLKNKLESLRDLVPMCSSGTSKLDCLNRAIDYIRWLHGQCAVLYEEITKTEGEVVPPPPVSNGAVASGDEAPRVDSSATAPRPSALTLENELSDNMCMDVCKMNFECDTSQAMDAAP